MVQLHHVGECLYCSQVGIHFALIKVGGKQIKLPGCHWRLCMDRGHGGMETPIIVRALAPLPAAQTPHPGEAQATPPSAVKKTEPLPFGFSSSGSFLALDLHFLQGDNGTKATRKWSERVVSSFFSDLRFCHIESLSVEFHGHGGARDSDHLQLCPWADFSCSSCIRVNRFRGL